MLAKPGVLMSVQAAPTRGEMNMTGPMVPRNETILNTEEKSIGSA